MLKTDYLSANKSYFLSQKTMNIDRCNCGSYRRKPGHGCNTCDPPSAEEKAADAVERKRLDAIARASSVKRILTFWDNGHGSIECVDPTTVRVGDYYVGFYPDGSGYFGMDISSNDHPELVVMVKDLLERFKGKLARELYKK